MRPRSRSTATAQAARDSGSRSAGGRPESDPRNALRDAPTTTGTPSGARSARPAQESEVLIGGLAESEAGIDEETFGTNPGDEGAAAGAGEVACHVGNDVGTEPRDLERRRRDAPHVVQDDRGVAFDDELEEPVGRVEPGDEIDDVRSRVQGAARDVDPPGVDRDRNRPVGGADSLDDGEHACELVVDRDLASALPVRRATRACRLAPHVEDRGACVGEAQPRLDGRPGRREAPAVGEGVGRDIEDRHHAPDSAEVEQSARGEEEAVDGHLGGSPVNRSLARPRPFRRRA